MKLMQAFKMAMRSISSNKTRALLTMLGVIIGVSSVIAAIAFAQGSTKSITDSIQSMGTNLIQISITGRNSNRSVTLEKLNQFMEANSTEIIAIAPQVSGSATVKFGTKSRSTSLIGTSADYETIRNVHVQSGRFILPIDEANFQKVALIGTAVVNDIFAGANPVGKSIKINGQMFLVVGVLEQKDNGQTQGDDDQVIIPATAAQKLTKTATVRTFSVQAASPEVVDSVMAKLTTFLTGIFKDTKSFRVFNQAQILTTLSNVTGSMAAVLGGIAAISLIVGGIGIMNIMLVSVTERTREIGIRKAIGAKKKSILTQFLIEAIVITGLGGLLGVLFGLFIIRFIIGGFNIVPAVYSVPWMAISFGISLIVGVVFGLFPAYKAASLNPIEALRHE